jgi:hypothetical protein
MAGIGVDLLVGRRGDKPFLFSSKSRSSSNGSVAFSPLRSSIVCSAGSLPLG